MSEPIVVAERVGKRYRIQHQRDRQPYVALRDVLTQAVGQPRAWWRARRRQHLACEDFWALKDVTFRVAAGEVVGIIGRNGAGKSTLLKVLSRITEPTTGRLVLDGRVASLLEVGTGFHPELTGRENIYLNGAILGMSRAEIVRKFDEIVAFAEIETFLDTPVKRYSSGMYVRLAFAVAAHLEPEILIVDEVLSVGDAEFQKKCLGKMHEVSRGGRTVLFVSHVMPAVQSLCTRAIWLERGAIAADGDVDAAIHRYLSHSPAGAADGPAGQVRIGDELTLDSFEMSPNPVETGGRVDFALRLQAMQPARVEHLALLFHSIQELRVAIVDLREAGAPRTLSAGETWALGGSIAALPLVEGDYRVGLGVGTTAYAGDHLGLIDLRVAPRHRPSGHVPYAAPYRGVVELDYQLRS
ncbi:MAG TPA: ABC transporter ATP-binding protein [Vicinamibacterales bacterium]|nr:ABC transporter ATP-binding protein [Vicinamibacterales bacterium]